MEVFRPIYSQSQDVPNQIVYNLPKRLGTGGVKFETFSSGISLYYMDIKPTKPITIVGEIPGGYCGISYNLIGHSEMRPSEFQHCLPARPNSSVHYTYPNLQILKETICCAHKVKIAIIFGAKTLREFASEDEEPFLPFLKGLQNETPAFGQGKIAPEMQRALNQLITCPYSGKPRALFLEGKVMELFAHRLEQLRVKSKSIPRQPCINASDIERIHYAVELLVRDPLNPPDLADLAGKIGMSRSKFYRNFKMVFGYSPMDHLRSYRLQTARKLLRQGKHNVSEVAFEVGFNNLSYFSRAFVAKFGVPPHQAL